MPKLGVQNIEKIILPSYIGSDDPGWVKVNKDISIGDAIEGLKVTDANDQAIAIAAAAIVEWNFTDDAGNILPITPENLRKLKAIDFVAIVQSFNMQDLTTLDTAKKKP